MYELSDLDIYMQATRISSKSWYTNFTLASLENKHMPNLANNLIKDGFYEGLSKGFPGFYSPFEVNRPLVPYGCWHRQRHDTGIFVNLGSNVLVEERFELYKLLNTPDMTDTYFCTKALQAKKNKLLIVASMIKITICM